MRCRYLVAYIAKVGLDENEMYMPRIADKELGDRLGAAGAVLIEGPRACGKTETARQQAASEVQLDVDENARQAMSIDPSLVLAGDRPRLIDEWQIEPAIWNHVRRDVDRRRSPGQYHTDGFRPCPPMTSPATPAQAEYPASGCAP